MVLSGHCLCKAVTYKADVDEPLITGYDHCDDCQRQSGSTYSLVVVVPKDKLTINGPTKSWAGKGSSGKAVHRIFCGECGSPIAHDPDAAPEVIAIKGGTLDAEIKKTLKPDTEIWTVGKLPFCQEHLAKPFTHMPEPANAIIRVIATIQPSSFERLATAAEEDGVHVELATASVPFEPAEPTVGDCDDVSGPGAPGRVGVPTHLGLVGGLVVGAQLAGPRCGGGALGSTAGGTTGQRGRDGAEDGLEDGGGRRRGGRRGQEAAQHRRGGRGDGPVEGVVGVVEQAVQGQAGAAGGPLGEEGAPAEALRVGVQVQGRRAVWVAERLGRFDGDAGRDHVPRVEDRRPAHGVEVCPLRQVWRRSLGVADLCGDERDGLEQEAGKRC
ncbi:hypothetical protein PpBr36_01633 [Pyricularia pennisetigena]|uniref:hypothetical protein n=1 Tax=Pyricularia pennisetigena TaxID=1578925 RepID=UPI001152F344|nr:hypothetical protein PpBr36_01633 [Pyricularia pennisetigena]TLS29013.1 hypothetical protein PpBr36_01633 [Pyricularia pennisetigena]